MARAAAPAAPTAAQPGGRRITVGRHDVDRGRVDDVADRLGRTTVSLAEVRAWQARVDLRVEGMPPGAPAWRSREAADFVRALDRLFPYWAFFLVDDSPMLRTFAAAMTSATNRQDATSMSSGSLLDADQARRSAAVDVLESRWLPAMSFLGELVGWSEDDDLRMTVRAYRMLLGDGHASGGRVPAPRTG